MSSYATKDADIAQYQQELTDIIVRCTSYDTAMTATMQYLSGLFSSKQIDDFKFDMTYCSPDNITVEVCVAFTWDYYTMFPFTVTKSNLDAQAYQRAMTVV